MKQGRNEHGDTLVEVLIAIVVIGIVFGSFFAAISTSSAASTTHRRLVTADAALRDFAEATKSAVRDPANGCGKSNPTTFTVNYTPAPGYSISSPTSLTQTCPPVTSIQREHQLTT